MQLLAFTNQEAFPLTCDHDLWHSRWILYGNTEDIKRLCFIWSGQISWSAVYSIRAVNRFDIFMFCYKFMTPQNYLNFSNLRDMIVLPIAILKTHIWIHLIRDSTLFSSSLTPSFPDDLKSNVLFNVSTFISSSIAPFFHCFLLFLFFLFIF